jgi:YfiH family protein
MILRSSLLDQINTIQHGFGTKDEPLPEFTQDSWSNRPTWKQVHGTEVARITQPKQSCGLVDALETDTPGIPISVVTADCVPILFAHQSGRSVAAIHAGWKGTLARITEKFSEHLLKRSESPREWMAAIGPCIGPCCYEVSAELIEKFKDEFPEIDPKQWNPQVRRLDLAGLNLEILKKIGLGDVECIRSCTRCSTSPAFYSYRRGDRESRQYSAILIQTQKPSIPSRKLP